MRATVPRPPASPPRRCQGRAAGVFPPYRLAAHPDGGIHVLHDYRTVTATEVERDVSEGLAALDGRVDALVAAPPPTVLEVVQVLDAVQAEANDIVGRAA